MTITRTVTREYDNTLYALRKNDCDYALIKNDEMYYAVKKRATETVTLTLTPLQKTWNLSPKDGFWVAPFSATYVIGGHDVRCEKGNSYFITGSRKPYEIKKTHCHHGDCDVEYIYGVVFDNSIEINSSYIIIVLNGYIDNEGTFYAELPSDAITKE